jgi:HSP20 family protein
VGFEYEKEAKNRKSSRSIVGEMNQKCQLVSICGLFLPKWHSKMSIFHILAFKMELEQRLISMECNHSKKIKLTKMKMITYKPGMRRKPTVFSPSFDKMFNDFFKDDLFSVNPKNQFPATNVKETDDAFVIELAVPGMNKDQFNVAIDNNMLTISAENKAEEKETTENYTRREFSFTSFSRQFHLPESVDQKAISAAYTNGVLAVTLAKKEEAKPVPAKTIEIV